MPLLCLKTSLKNHRITYARKNVEICINKTWSTSPYAGLAITLFRTFLQKTFTPNENCINNSMKMLTPKTTNQY
jgi:hypothetical protein